LFVYGSQKSYSLLQEISIGFWFPEVTNLTNAAFDHILARVKNIVGADLRSARYVLPVLYGSEFCLERGTGRS